MIFVPFQQTAEEKKKSERFISVCHTFTHIVQTGGANSSMENPCFVSDPEKGLSYLLSNAALVSEQLKVECFKTSVKNGCWLCWHNATATITTLKPVHAESVHLFIIFSSLISFLHTWIYFSFPFHSTLKPKDTPRDPVLMLLCWDNIRWCFFSVVADG